MNREYQEHRTQESGYSWGLEDDCLLLPVEDKIGYCNDMEVMRSLHCKNPHDISEERRIHWEVHS